MKRPKIDALREPSDGIATAPQIDERRCRVINSYARFGGVDPASAGCFARSEGKGMLHSL